MVESFNDGDVPMRPLTNSGMSIGVNENDGGGDEKPAVWVGLVECSEKVFDLRVREMMGGRQL